MKSLYRWIFHHSRFSMAIAVITVTLLTYYGLDPAIFSFGIRFLIIFSLTFSCNTFIQSMPDKLLRKPLEILEQQCDPYPFLEELEQLVSHQSDDFTGQMTNINYAMALVQTGNLEKALEVLQSIQIDKFSNTSPFAKFIYYNNLCDVLTRLERFSEADYWYQKGLELYDELPKVKLKNTLERTVQMNRIEALYRDQDYSAALRLLSRIPCPTQRNLMEAALLAARCNIKLAEYDKAREKLQYVADKGNLLHCAAVAKELLDTLS